MKRDECLERRNLWSQLFDRIETPTRGFDFSSLFSYKKFVTHTPFTVKRLVQEFKVEMINGKTPPYIGPKYPEAFRIKEVRL